jgi:hypothetical protein
MSFDDVFKKSTISKKFAFVINTPTFRKAFALKHKGVWNSRVDYWFRHDKYAYLKTWLPVLLETGAWVPDKNDGIPLIFAIINGHVDIVKLLLANGFDPSLPNNIPLIRAISQGHVKIVELLLESGRIHSDDGFGPFLRLAVREGKRDIVELFLRTGLVDPSFDDNSAIMIASNYGFSDIVKILLEDPRVDPSANNNGALKNARERGYTVIVNLLEDYFKRKQEREAGQEGESKRLKLGRVLF